MEQLKKVRFGSVADCIVLRGEGGNCHQQESQTPRARRAHGTGAHQQHVNEPTGACRECYATATHSILDPPRVGRSRGWWTGRGTL